MRKRSLVLPKLLTSNFKPMSGDVKLIRGIIDASLDLIHGHANKLVVNITKSATENKGAPSFLDNHAVNIEINNFYLECNEVFI